MPESVSWGGDFKLPPLGWGLFRITEVSFKPVEKDPSRDNLVVKMEFIEEGPDNGAEMTIYNDYSQAFVLKRIQGLVFVVTGREDAGVDKTYLDDVTGRNQLITELTGSRLGVEVSHEDWVGKDGKDKTSAKPSEICSEPELPEWKAEEAAREAGAVVETPTATGTTAGVPDSLDGIVG